MPVSVLTALPITREEDAFGQILGGGLLYTTQAGSDVPLATYQDINCTIPNTNPVVLDATGRAFVRYLPQAYKLKLTDKDGTVLWTVDNFWPPVSTEPVSATTFITALINPRTQAEIGAGITPTNYLYPQGNPRRYGAVLDGITDDVIALQQWATVPGSHTFPGATTGVTSQTLTLVSNSKYDFGEGSLIATGTNDINILYATNANNITIRGAKLQYTSVGTAPNIGGIALNICHDCVVEECEFQGMQFAGIYAPGALRCTFRNNYFHDCLGVMQNSGDIYVPSVHGIPASYNVITGNQCFGPSNEFGIAVWDPDAGTLCTHNIISNNRIANHNGYGILLYFPDGGDSYNQVIGNSVENISVFLGQPNKNTSSGTGIYLSGIGISGSEVIGNTVRNCCIGTIDETLSPAAIGVNGSGPGGGAGGVPIVIQGNTVSDMPQWHSIHVTGWLGGITISGNTIRHPTATGANLGDAIRIVNSDCVTIVGNNILLLTTTVNQEGIMIWGRGANNTNIIVSGNTINGGHHAQIRCSQTGGVVNQYVTIVGNNLNGGDNTCIPLLFDSTAASDVQVTGNNLFGGAATVISQAACVNITYENNRLKGTGSAFLTTSGACSGSFFGISNLGPGNGVGVSNGATGFVVDARGALSAPVAGLWAVGDTSRNMTPSTGAVFMNVCTVAGSPGTWKSISNT